MSITGVFSFSGQRCWSAMVIFCALLWTASSDNVYDSLSLQRSNIATCRARCLNQIGKDIFDDSQCESKPNCNMCWKTCELFYNNFTLWGPMCGEPDICFPGCQVSCEFHRTKDSSVKSTDSTLSNMGPLDLKKKGVEEELHIEWTRPQCGSRVAYIVMLRHNMKWLEVGQTLKENMIVEDHRYTNEPTQIAILAFSENGLVGERVDVYDNPNELYYSDQAPVQQLKRKSVQLPTYDQWVPSLVSLLDKKSIFGVESKLEWPHPSQSGNCKYEVNWQVQDSKYDIVGTMYTNYNFAEIVLWPNYVHSVRVSCLESNGKITKISQSLTIDTKLARSEPEMEGMNQECGKTFLLEALIATVSTLTFLLLIGLIFCAIKLFQTQSGHSNNDLENGVQDQEDKVGKSRKRSIREI